MVPLQWVELSLDGYSPSFVDEMIGNLVYDFSLSVVKDNLNVVSQTDARWPIMLNNKTYPEWEKRRKNKQQPTNSANGPDIILTFSPTLTSISTF